MNIDNTSNKYNYYKKVTFSVDRFEKNFAICENKCTGELVNIPIVELPKNTQKGSIIVLENGKYNLDIDATYKEQKEIKNLVNNLFKRKK